VGAVRVHAAHGAGAQRAALLRVVRRQARVAFDRAHRHGFFAPCSPRPSTVARAPDVERVRSKRNGCHVCASCFTVVATLVLGKRRAFLSPSREKKKDAHTDAHSSSRKLYTAARHPRPCIAGHVLWAIGRRP
jgi:hypothetical protein